MVTVSNYYPEPYEYFDPMGSIDGLLYLQNNIRYDNQSVFPSIHFPANAIGTPPWKFKLESLLQ
jgi:hypothetical protein